MKKPKGGRGIVKTEGRIQPYSVWSVSSLRIYRASKS